MPRRDTTGGFLPMRPAGAVYHVGSMRSSDKRNISLEGSGLSVSMHPTVWRYLDQGWIHGDLWRLERERACFVDRLAMSSAHKQLIFDWAAARGYGTPSTASGDGFWGTDALWALSPGMVTHQGNGFDFALLAYVAEETAADGVWWHEPLRVIPKRSGGWAPRGVILPGRIPLWSAEKLDGTQAPDRQLFTRGGQPRRGTADAPSAPAPR